MLPSSRLGSMSFLYKLCLQLIIDQDHDDVCFLCSLCCCIYFKSLCLCLCPGFASLVKTDNYMASGLLCIQCMCMTLAAVTDNCDCLAFQSCKITIFLISKSLPFSFPPSFCVFALVLHKIIVYQFTVLVIDLNVEGSSGQSGKTGTCKFKNLNILEHTQESAQF